MIRIMKDKKAITLIALVITIVVLIILATVAIQLSLGQNGIFNRAKTAKEQYTNAQEQEKSDIDKTTNNIDSYINGSRLDFNGFEMVQLTDLCVGSSWHKTEIVGGLDQYRYLYFVHCSESGNEIYGVYTMNKDQFKSKYTSSSTTFNLYSYTGSTQRAKFYYLYNDGKDEIYIYDDYAHFAGCVYGIK